MLSQRKLQALRDGGRGAVLVEHALLFAFVVIVAIATLSAFGVSLLELYTDSLDRYAGATRNISG